MDEVGNVLPCIINTINCKINNKSTDLIVFDLRDTTRWTICLRDNMLKKIAWVSI